MDAVRGWVLDLAADFGCQGAVLATDFQHARPERHGMGDCVGPGAHPGRLRRADQGFAALEGTQGVANLQWNKASVFVAEAFLLSSSTICGKVGEEN